MAGLMGDLITSSQALNTHATSLSTIGRNLSNVNNSGYARQSVETESYAGPGGAYYTRSQVVNARDAVLDRQLNNEISKSGSSNAAYQLYNQLNNVMSESLNGSLGASLKTAQAEGTGITGGLSTFFNSWSALAASPNSSGAKSNVLSSAQELATRLNGASDALDQVESNLNASLDADIEDANELLNQIATLNSNIVRMEARQQGSASSLMDDRQAAIEKLASLIDFSSASQADGSVTLSTTDNPAQTLVAGGNSGTLAVTTGANGVRNGLSVTFNGTTQAISPDAGSLSVLNPANTSAVIGGMRSDLDALANQLITSVNTAYAASGQGTFFTGTGAANIAVAITDYQNITAANANAGTGDNQVASAISALSSRTFNNATDQINGSFYDYSAAVATNVADSLSTATDSVETQEQMEQLVRENRDNISGVSTEEEMTTLLRTQNAYQASARVMSTVNTLLELVTTRLGA